jgi:hypothetical protein
MINIDIINWINRLDSPQKSIGNHSICPYAKSSTYKIIETRLDKISDVDESVDVIIYKVEDNVTLEQLNNQCKTLNAAYRHLIFLPDHKDKKTYIKEAQTNNGKYNLILCQKREKLEKFRMSLMKTDYYNYWDDEYLKEILGT